MERRHRGVVASKAKGHSRPIQGILHAAGGHHWTDPVASVAVSAAASFGSVAVF
jgi:hypothetical protein